MQSMGAKMIESYKAEIRVLRNKLLVRDKLIEKQSVVIYNLNEKIETMVKRSRR